MGTTFANLVLDENGKSYPQVEMTVSQLNFRKSRLESKNSLGVWKAGMPGTIAFAAGQSIRPFKVISVFKIAVVVVSVNIDSDTKFKNLTLDDVLS